MLWLIAWPFRLAFFIILMPFRLVRWFLVPSGRGSEARDGDTMDDFLDFIEAYACLTDDE